MKKIRCIYCGEFVSNKTINAKIPYCEKCKKNGLKFLRKSKNKIERRSKMENKSKEITFTANSEDYEKIKDFANGMGLKPASFVKMCCFVYINKEK